MKRIWLLTLLWAALCLGGALWAALGLQGQVAVLASEELSKSADYMPEVKVTAEGQSLVLSGIVNRQSDMERVIKQMGDELRLPGAFGPWGPFNPVRKVVNSMGLIPRPEGWGVLAATGEAVHLRGMAGTENEANRLSLAVKSAGQLDRLFASELRVDGELYIESDKLEESIQSLPALTTEAMKRGVLAVTIWGKKWRVLDLEKPAEVLRREVLAMGLPSEAWETEMFAEVSRVRRARENYVEADEEKTRKERLAPGHVVMAVRGSEILLRGELGTEKACELLAEAIRASSPDRDVIDELAHSTHRKPEDSPKKLASTLPRLPSGLKAKYITVGTPDIGWKAMTLEELDIEKPETITQEMLPDGLDRRLALPDVTTALSWLHSIESAPMQREGAKLPPYFMITAVGKHVYLRGAVAEEAVRTQVEAAARRLYGSRELDVAVRLDASYQSIGQALQTVATLPPPPSPDTAGFIAFSFSGEEWRSKVALARLLEVEGLQQSGLLPIGFSMNVVMPDLLAVTPAVKAHLAELSKGPPGIPMQPSRQP